MKHTLKLGAAVLAAAALIIPSATAASAAPASVTLSFSSKGWTGYGEALGDYTSVEGLFPVPSVTGASGSAASIWTGLGGGEVQSVIEKAALEQTGVVMGIVNGKAEYRAFWEVIYAGGAPSVNLPHLLPETVKPGDEIVSKVSYSPSPASTDGTYTLYVADQTRNWSVSVPVTGKSTATGGTSHLGAEAIVEDPVSATTGKELPLAHFTPASFESVAIDGSYSWATRFNNGYYLSTGKDSVSPLYSNGSFTVTWKHS